MVEIKVYVPTEEDAKRLAESDTPEGVQCDIAEVGRHEIGNDNSFVLIINVPSWIPAMAIGVWLAGIVEKQLRECAKQVTVDDRPAGIDGRSIARVIEEVRIERYTES